MAATETKEPRTWAGQLEEVRAKVAELPEAQSASALHAIESHSSERAQDYELTSSSTLRTIQTVAACCAVRVWVVMALLLRVVAMRGAVLRRLGYGQRSWELHSLGSPASLSAR
jgi:hypothetical protein